MSGGSGGSLSGEYLSDTAGDTRHYGGLYVSDTSVAEHKGAEEDRPRPSSSTMEQEVVTSRGTRVNLAFSPTRTAEDATSGGTRVNLAFSSTDLHEQGEESNEFLPSSLIEDECYNEEALDMAQRTRMNSTLHAPEEPEREYCPHKHIKAQRDRPHRRTHQENHRMWLSRKHPHRGPRRQTQTSW